MLPIFFGKVENGKLTLDKPINFLSYLCSLKGNVQITVGKRRKPISTLEHRYYRGLIVPLVAKEIGEDNDTVHELMKAKFLKRIIWKEILGEQVKFEFIPSTATLSTIEAEKYFEECRMWAAKFLKINVPLPGEILID